MPKPRHTRAKYQAKRKVEDTTGATPTPTAAPEKASPIIAPARATATVRASTRRPLGGKAATMPIQYPFVVQDLTRIGIVTAITVALLVTLSFVLGR